MRQKSMSKKNPVEKTVRDIRRVIPKASHCGWISTAA
jgi:hypothetical protein